MTKTIITIIIIIALAVGGYFIFRPNKSNLQTNNEVSDEVSEQTNGKKIAFSEFVKRGGSYKCNVKQSVSDVENNGTVYINGSNMRGEYSTIAEGRTMETSFIMKDGYSYTWSSAFPSMGFKMKIPTSTEVNTNPNTQGTYSWDAEQIGDYNCEPWVVDQSQFVIPSSITFSEVGQ